MPSSAYKTTKKMTTIYSRTTLMNAALEGDIKTIQVAVRLFPSHLRETNAEGDIPLAEYRRRTATPCKLVEAQLLPPFQPAWAAAWTPPPWYGKTEVWRNVAW